MSQDNPNSTPPPDANPASEPAPLKPFTAINPDTTTPVSQDTPPAIPPAGSVLKRVPAQSDPATGGPPPGSAATSAAVPGQAAADLVDSTIKSVESVLPEPLANLAEKVTQPLERTINTKLEDPNLVNEITQPVVQAVTSHLPQASASVPQSVTAAAGNMAQPVAQQFATGVVQPAIQSATSYLPKQVADATNQIAQPVVQQLAGELATPLATAAVAAVPQQVWQTIDKIPEQSRQTARTVAPTLMTLAQNVATGNYGGQTQTDEPPKPAGYSVAEDAKQVKLALSMGAVIMELRGRVWQDFYGLDPSKPDQGQSQNLVDGFSDNFWRASTWRGLYSRLLGLHKDLLGDDPVDLISYGLSEKVPAYLTDELNIEYVNAGLGAQTLNFRIAEKLRRALNFLICLYQEMDGFDQVLEQVFGGQSPALKLPTTQEDNVHNRYRYLIQNLTEQVGILLNAWDSYVREQLFARSSTMLMARYGYNCGRAMSEVSWLLGAKTAQLRIKHSVAEAIKDSDPQTSSKGLESLFEDDPFDTATAIDEIDTDAELGQKTYEIWLDIFSPTKISYMQRQLSAIVNVLEEDYKAKQNSATTDDQDLDDDEASDLKSPRTAINSVIQSLGYWQITVLELSEKGRLQKTDDAANPDIANPKPPNWAPNLKLGAGWTAANLQALQSALSQQQGNWFDLVSGRQSLLSFRVTSIASDVLQEYRGQIVKQFSQDIIGAMQKQISELANVANSVSKEVATSAKKAIEGLFDRRLVYIAIGVVGVGIVLLMLAVMLGSSFSGLGVGGTGLGLAGLLQAGGIGWMQKRNQQAQAQVEQTSQTESQKVAQKTEDVQQTLKDEKNANSMMISNLKQVPAYIEEVLERGFTQLKKELRLISATLALSGPLAEFITHNCDVKNDWDFLNKVVWNDQVKKSQLDRIIVAAFGPVGQLIVSTATTIQEQINTTPNGTTATTTTVSTTATVSATTISGPPAR